MPDLSYNLYIASFIENSYFFMNIRHANNFVVYCRCNLINYTLKYMFSIIE